MQPRFAIPATVLVIFASLVSAAEAPDPSGVWARGDGNAQVRIAACGENVCATNTWIKDTSGGEEVGDKLIMTLQAKSATVLAGRAYDPKRGLTYSITLTVKEGGMVTRGCVVGGLLCKDVIWKPVRK